MFDWYWSLLFFALLHLWITGIYAIFFHRVYAHRLARSAPKFDYMARIALWLSGVGAFKTTPGKMLKIWVAIHRKHHRYSDTDQDPISPKNYSFRDLLFEPKHVQAGSAYYLTDEEIETITQDLPVYDDWIEHVMNKYKFLFWVPLVAVCSVLFGLFGSLLAVTMLVLWHYWGNLHNCLSHAIGYRTQEATHSNDCSLNIFPIAVFFGGEDLAANHHDYPDQINFQRRWFEIDGGYLWIRFYQWLGLIDIVPSRYRSRYLASIMQENME